MLTEKVGSEGCLLAGGREANVLGNVAEIQNFLRITKINLWRD